ncbi:MAG: tellurite resistance/C4-dicarboxylate transporter family protein [Candidatus Dormibacteria bacterium]
MASFAAVMATGIVSVAAGQEAQSGVATVLSWLAAATFCALTALHATRAALHPRVALAELGHPSTAFDAGSAVAALAVTGVALASRLSTTAVLTIWLCQVALWLATISVAIRALRRHRHAGLVHVSSGRWLLAVVATESVAVLAPAAGGGAQHEAIAVAAGACWAAGLAAYPVLVVVIVTRLRRRGWRAVDLTPDHWILMGALAICTLSATRLLAMKADAGLHNSLAVAAMATWAGASVLYAVLAAASARRWMVSTATRAYDTRWWASVFPLGMYSACSFALSAVLPSGALHGLAMATFWVALTAWLLVSLLSVAAIARTSP